MLHVLSERRVPDVPARQMRQGRARPPRRQHSSIDIGLIVGFDMAPRTVVTSSRKRGPRWIAAIACRACARTASTSLPSTLMVGRPWPTAEAVIAARSDMLSRRWTQACHRVFLQPNSSGSCHCFQGIWTHRASRWACRAAPVEKIVRAETSIIAKPPAGRPTIDADAAGGLMAIRRHRGGPREATSWRGARFP